MPRRDEAELSFENGLVLDAIQALVGSISENFLAISLEADQPSGSVVVYFALAVVPEKLGPGQWRRLNPPTVALRGFASHP